MLFWVIGVALNVITSVLMRRLEREIWLKKKKQVHHDIESEKIRFEDGIQAAPEAETGKEMDSLHRAFWSNQLS